MIAVGILLAVAVVLGIYAYNMPRGEPRPLQSMADAIDSVRNVRELGGRAKVRRLNFFVHYLRENAPAAFRRENDENFADGFNDYIFAHARNTSIADGYEANQYAWGYETAEQAWNS